MVQEGSSTIDYFIVSENLFNVFDFINVRPPTEMSDHSVIWCGKKTNVTYTEVNDDSENVYAKLPGQFIVDETTKQKYIESLLDNDYSRLLQNFLRDVENDAVDIETLTYQFPGIVNLSAQKSAAFRVYSGHKKKKRLKKKWFNNNCCIMKRELRKLGRRLQMHSNNFDLKFAFHKLKKEYNKTLKMTKNLFYKTIIEHLDTLHKEIQKPSGKL